jgi:hypothetical protein
MGRKKKGDDFLDLPDPDAEQAEAAADEPAVPAPKGKGKKGKKGKAAASFAGEANWILCVLIESVSFEACGSSGTGCPATRTTVAMQMTDCFAGQLLFQMVVWFAKW